MLKTYAATVKNGQLEVAGGESLPDGEAHVTVEVRTGDGVPTDAEGPTSRADDLPRLRSPRLASPEDAEFFRKTVRRILPAEGTPDGGDA